jgi:hypothetical protein
MQSGELPYHIAASGKGAVILCRALLVLFWRSKKEQDSGEASLKLYVFSSHH